MCNVRVHSLRCDSDDPPKKTNKQTNKQTNKTKQKKNKNKTKTIKKHPPQKQKKTKKKQQTNNSNKKRKQQKTKTKNKNKSKTTTTTNKQITTTTTTPNKPDYLQRHYYPANASIKQLCNPSMDKPLKHQSSSPYDSFQPPFNPSILLVSQSIGKSAVENKLHNTIVIHS